METTINYPLLAKLIAAELSKTVPAWLTPAQAAAYTGIPEKTLEQYRRDRTGPKYSKVGKHVRYSPEDLDTWVRSKAHAA